MKRVSKRRSPAFERVRAVGSTLAGVEESVRYDGSPVLKLGGAFLAGVAMHRSAEPETLVVRYDIADREFLLEEAPETYYVTDFYRRYPLVLARLPQLSRDALRDLLVVSWRMTRPKARGRSAKRTTAASAFTTGAER